MAINFEEIIKTKITKCDKGIIEKRKLMISEAINFPCGRSINKQRKTVIKVLPNDKDVYILKPGKETLRSEPNLHDMNLNVGKNNRSETSNFTFEDIWEYLLKISVINQITFKKVLVILYRICYLIDHIESDGKLRYEPSREISELLERISYSLEEGFKDKFKEEEIGFIEFLYFVDILAWNEDVKYHTENNEPEFEGKFKPKVGRINTILTLISVPLMINEFLLNIIENVKHIEKININLILATIQKMSKSRGMFTMSNNELIEKLYPYLVK